jgi:putative endonuclease
MLQHYENKGNKQTFTGRYHCYKLIYYERFDKPMDAIDREKEIKKWRRSKKEALINTMNPHWKFLNEAIKGG